ncbi:lipopolysaccharide heptosyltransferase [Sulfurimonas hongkongensis]|uniref:Lipopolysaccharide heptosyltransferase 1 n=1 Tax=Sulfurimonas hongkongensis TaxID=1172190 RepID=T0JSV4_9BACT|nr:lipopolysaccharide heptosyltransferase I [Sulfurimonas hongkongensis]EQB40062.1 lipopolysaccharide heptosyltransferase [Sulfurimonas hongkongensis]
MKKDIKHIAIVRLSALGDIVNSAVILQFIHQKYPNAKIDWITEEIFAPLLQNHPLLHKVHTINLKELKKSKSLTELFKTISKLCSLGKFDIIIDMQGLLKSAIVSRLIGKKTHGFDKNSSRESLSRFFYNTTSYIEYDENIVKRNTFLASDGLGFKINDLMLLKKKRVFETQLYPLNKSGEKNIAIVIGASWESKKYPKERVAELCSELGQNCYIIWGNDKEREEALWICKNSSSAILAPKLSLFELVSFISSVDLLIGNDTGPTHIAWAQNIPSITLFGPTTKRMIYVTSKNLFVKSHSKVNIYKIDKNDFSIGDIEVKSITKKARELLI